MVQNKYYPPSHKADNFHCPHCQVYAKQYWGNLITYAKYQWQFRSNDPLPDSFTVSKCTHCDKWSLWIDEKLAYPSQIAVEPANQDMPEDVMELYDESAQILTVSPRASAALLRLALQTLLGYVGGKGKSINDDIASIVANGVESQTQKALDILRVFGNNGAHPGEINLKENNEMVNAMFPTMNFIVDRLITQKNQIDSMFESLPDSVRQQIEKRDGKETNEI